MWLPAFIDCSFTHELSVSTSPQIEQTSVMSSVKHKIYAEENHLLRKIWQSAYFLLQQNKQNCRSFMLLTWLLQKSYGHFLSELVNRLWIIREPHRLVFQYFLCKLQILKMSERNAKPQIEYKKTLYLLHTLHTNTPHDTTSLCRECGRVSHLHLDTLHPLLLINAL